MHQVLGVIPQNQGRKEGMKGGRQGGREEGRKEGNLSRVWWHTLVILAFRRLRSA
jgi:hypothetical protein